MPKELQRIKLREKRSKEKNLALAHGVFDLICGLWPILSRKSFEKATGGKVDYWLVRTVGLLLTSIGGTLVLDSLKNEGRTPPEIKLLAIGSAASLGAISTYYAYKNRISRIYFLDTLMQFGWVASWMLQESRIRKI